MSNLILVDATLVFDGRKCVSVIISPEERKKLARHPAQSIDSPVDIGEKVSVKLFSE